MKSAPFTYHAPASTDEALELLGELPGALPLAGGQSLMPRLNTRRTSPEHLVDLARTGMTEITHQDDRLRVGAMVTQRDAERHELLRRLCPLAADALGWVGHRATRNRGTIGGSFVELARGAELLAAGAALDAAVTVRSRSATRELSLDELCVAYGSSSLRGDELITVVSLAAWPAGHGWAFAEAALRPSGPPLLSMAAVVDLAESGEIEKIAIGTCGLGERPCRLAAAERELAGRAPSARDIARAARHAEQLEAPDDRFAPATYRSHAARELTGRVLARTIKRAR